MAGRLWWTGCPVSTACPVHPHLTSGNELLQVQNVPGLTPRTEINNGDRAETVKLLEENAGINLRDGSSSNPLDTVSRARATNFCTSEDSAK